MFRERIHFLCAHTLVELLINVGQIGDRFFEEFELVFTGGQEAIQIEMHFEQARGNEKEFVWLVFELSGSCLVDNLW